MTRDITLYSNRLPIFKLLITVNDDTPEVVTKEYFVLSVSLVNPCEKETVIYLVIIATNKRYLFCVFCKG